MASEPRTWATAIALFAELVNDRKRLLGSDHARTIESSLQHARFLAAAGERQRAATLLTETRRVCVNALGDQHPLSQFTEHLLRTLSR